MRPPVRLGAHGVVWLVVVAVLAVLVVMAPAASARSGSPTAASRGLSGAIVDDPLCNLFSIQPHFLNISKLYVLPFWVRFGGRSFRRLEVTNTGYVSFRYLGPGEQIDPEYVPSSAQSSYESSTLNVAPFWASGQGTGRTVSGGPTTKYGEITYQGRRALCVNWTGIAPANTCISGAPHRLEQDEQLSALDRRSK